MLDSIEFNPLKHHLGYIKIFLNENIKLPPERFSEKLKIIGHSAMDVYFGKLTLNDILFATFLFLKSNNLLNKKTFIEWLFNNGKDYKVISLKDKSKWTLRPGKDEKKFIHLHPARNQPLVIRLKANTLKSALLFVAFSTNQKQITNNFDLNELNNLRWKYLNLPPIKNLEESKKLEFVINLFNKGKIFE